MKVTSNQIQITYDSNMEIESLKLQTPIVRSGIIDFLRDIKRREFKLIETYQTCDIKYHLSNFDPKSLNYLLQDEFYNYDLMKAVSCIISSIITPDNIQIYSNNHKIKKYIDKIEQIGENSVYGIAFLAGYKNEDFVVIKSQKGQSGDDLIHECVIGLYGTNQLRKIIPNFAYVYGNMKCLPPLLGGFNLPQLRCPLNPKNELSDYAIYENIGNSSLFRDVCKSCSFREFSELFMQIVLAIKIANDENDFCHYDLHSSNVLIRKTGKESFYIQYPIEEEINGSKKIQNYYLKSTNGDIATIIDYGSAYIKYPFNKETREGKSLGSLNNQSTIGMYNDRSIPIADVYKLLCYCLLSMKADTFKQAKKFLYFFTDERISYKDPDGFLNKDYTSFFILPEAISRQFNYNEFIVHCVSIIDSSILLMNHPVNEMILKCGEYHCSSFENIINDALPQHIPQNKNPITFDEFIDVYYHSSSSEEGDPEVKRNFKVNFDNAYQISINEFKILNDIYNKNKTNYEDFIHNDKLNMDNIETNDDLFFDILGTLNNLFKIIQKFVISYKELYYQYEMINYMLDVYGLEKNNDINVIPEGYSNKFNYFNNIIETLQSKLDEFPDQNNRKMLERFLEEKFLPLRDNYVG